MTGRANETAEASARGRHRAPADGPTGVSRRTPFWLWAIVCVAVVVVAIWFPIATVALVLVAAIHLFVKTAGATTLVILFAASALLIPGRWVFGPLGAIGTPALLVGVAGAAWWVFGRIQTDLGLDLGRQPVRWILLAWAWANAAAFVAADSRFMTGAEVSATYRNLFQVLALTGIALLICDGLRSADVPRVLNRVADFVAVCGTVGLLQYFVGVNLVTMLAPPGLRLNSEINSILQRSVLDRVSGTALHPIEFGAIMAASLPLLLQLALHEPNRWWRWVRVGIVGLAIPLSVSRTAVAVTGIGLVVLLSGWSNRRRLNFLIAAVPAILAVRLVAPGTLGTIRALFVYFGADPSIQSRTNDYGTMFAQFAERPFFGRGLGTYLPDLYDYVDNQLLLSLVTTGIVGVLALLVLAIGGTTVARQVYHKADDLQARELGNAVAASLSGLIVAFMTYDALGFPIHAAMFFLLIGISGAMWRIHVRDRRVASAGQPEVTVR